MPTATVTVPATTANIGPGFDCLGAALTLYNQFQFTPSDQFAITVSGAEAERVGRTDTNLAYQAFTTFYQKIGQVPPTIHLHITLQVPLARGLGSSSTAIVGGILGANLLTQKPLDRQALAVLATEIEGHPDNVVPALLGGCQLIASNGGQPLTICPIPWQSALIPVVVIPDFELSTAEARQALPDAYARADAIFNMAHLGVLLRGLQTGEEDWLKRGLCDRIHQPYRKSLITGYDAVRQAALDAGAWGVVISGAGPTLLAITPANAVEAVQAAMLTTWQCHGVTAKALALKIDGQGAVAHT